MVMPAGIVGQLLLTDGTDTILFSPQVVKLSCSSQRVFHLTRKPFLQVEFPGRAIRVGIPFDFDVSPDGYPTGGKQAPFFAIVVAKEDPIPYSHPFEVLAFNLPFAFLRMAACRPAPDGLKDRMINIGKRLFAHHMLMVLSPTPNDRVQLSD
jgi:hypothetical protein